MRRILIIGSGLVFLGLAVFPLAGLLDGSSPSSNPSTPSSQNSVPREELQSMAEGYERVLKREPENPVALQGLAEARLKMGDLRGGLEPLKKLARLYPEEKPLQELVQAIEQQLKSPQSRPSPPTPQ